MKMDLERFSATSRRHSMVSAVRGTLRKRLEGKKVEQ